MSDTCHECGDASHEGSCEHAHLGRMVDRMRAAETERDQLRGALRDVWSLVGPVANECEPCPMPEDEGGGSLVPTDETLGRWGAACTAACRVIDAALSGAPAPMSTVPSYARRLDESDRDHYWRLVRDRSYDPSVDNYATVDAAWAKIRGTPGAVEFYTACLCGCETCLATRSSKEVHTDARALAFVYGRRRAAKEKL